MGTRQASKPARARSIRWHRCCVSVPGTGLSVRTSWLVLWYGGISGMQRARGHTSNSSCVCPHVYYHLSIAHTHRDSISHWPPKAESDKLGGGGRCMQQYMGKCGLGAGYVHTYVHVAGRSARRITLPSERRAYVPAFSRSMRACGSGPARYGTC